MTQFQVCNFRFVVPATDSRDSCHYSEKPRGLVCPAKSFECLRSDTFKGETTCIFCAHLMSVFFPSAFSSVYVKVHFSACAEVRSSKRTAKSKHEECQGNKLVENVNMTLFDNRR